MDESLEEQEREESRQMIVSFLALCERMNLGKLSVYEPLQVVDPYPADVPGEG